MPALDFPANPTDGQVYANWIFSTSKGAWQAKPMESAKTVTSDVPPANPADGDQWFSTVDGVLYVYVVDVDGGQWVESRSAIISDGYYSPNYVINGGFDINQRAFTSTTTSGAFGFDRWFLDTSGGTTYSSQTFTPGTAPVDTLEGTTHARIVTSGQTGTTPYSVLINKIEDVRTLDGQSATISFWAKAASGAPAISVEFLQYFGTGGSATVTAAAVAKRTISTGWSRYSATVSIPSIVGKTIGSGSYLQLNLWFSAGSAQNSRTDSLGIQSNTFDVWGVQLESGSVATPFRRNANSIQGELAACQRYYYRVTTDVAYGIFGTGVARNTTGGWIPMNLPVTMRVAPTSLDTTGIAGNYMLIGSNTITCNAVPYLSGPGRNVTEVIFPTAGSATIGQAYMGASLNQTGVFLGFNAEL